MLAEDVHKGFVHSMAFDPAATERRRSSAQARFDRLAERPDGNGDDVS